MNFKKAYIFILLFLVAAVANAQVTFPQSSPREVRAVWFTTIGGLDWPKNYARSAEGIRQQKEELCDKLDRLRETGINTILFQTRIRGTVIYPSDIEPWDGCLSGRPGISPGYDALAFAIDECHKRGMSIQAWVVAYPIMSTKVARQLGKQALPKRHPKLCRLSGNKWMMDPGVPGTDDYIADICKEIVRKYDVDGIHLDYVRYPERGIPFNDNLTYRRYGKKMKRDEWKRANVTRCVQKVHAAVKALKPWVVLSCSPVGKHDDLPRYSSFGWNARNTVSQDVQTWMKTGIMDEIFPMMYFKDNHFFPFAYDWIKDCGGRIVTPGLGIYLLNEKEKNWDLDIIKRQLSFLRAVKAEGQAYFRCKFLLNNEKGIISYLKDFYYPTPALRPALTWEDSIAPAKPGGMDIDKENYKWKVTWKVSHDPTPGTGVKYNIYCSEKFPVDIQNGATLMASYLEKPEYTFNMESPYERSLYYGITAIDRFGNESEVAKVNSPVVIRKIEAEFKVDKGIVKLPPMDTEFLILHDATDRELSIMEYDTIFHVKNLMPGLYKIYTQNKRGGPHRLGTFLIK